VVFGTTLGNGNLELRDRGKTAFNFYDRAQNKNVRLLLKQWPEGMSKEETTEFILNAPFDQVFSQFPARFEAPKDSFSRKPGMICPRCGEQCREPFLRVVDGEIVCLDCAEKA
jgi:formylmethanofuran dehydrogenase subunit E